MIPQIALNGYLVIAPELCLLLLLFVVLGYTSMNNDENERLAGVITAWGTAIVLAISTFLTLSTIDAAPQAFWGGMVRFDGVGNVFRIMFLIGLLFTTMFSLDTPSLQRGEYFVLLVAATMGFNFMAMSTDLIMMLVALETASISLYLLAGFVTKSDKSAEAGMKYFVYGAFASALMLYGMSLLYGLTGETNIYLIADVLAGTETNIPVNSIVLITAVLLIAGFAFKVSAVPFHWWAPDVYEGAPTPVTGFASTSSKAAGFAVFIRVFAAGTVGSVTAGIPVWWAMLVAICIITMMLGNMLAIYQTNIKRMLAYSSVAQAGYVLIGLVALTPDGAGAGLFYLLMYVITNLAAFGVIVIVSNQSGGSEEMEDFYGLSRRAPFVALAFMLALLSLGGIPPTAGFFAKFFLFRAAIDAGQWWLALIGILLAFISLYYYLNIIKYLYLFRGENESVALPVSRAAKVALFASVAGILYLGIFAGPAFEWTRDAAQWFFSG